MYIVLILGVNNAENKNLTGMQRGRKFENPTTQISDIQKRVAVFVFYN